MPAKQAASLPGKPASQLCHASPPYWAAWARHDGQPDSPIQPANHASQPTRTAALNIPHTRQHRVSWAALRSTNHEPLRAHDARPKPKLVGEISSSRGRCACQISSTREPPRQKESLGGSSISVWGCGLRQLNGADDQWASPFFNRQRDFPRAPAVKWSCRPVGVTFF